jgi:hypothetical protein
MSLSLPAAAADLAETAAAFAHWRSSTPLGSRIPEELWSRAVALSGTHGASKVAATLRLDYYRLKRRLMAAPEAPAPAPPAFVEMTLGVPHPLPACVLALSDSQGRSLRIEWTRAVASEVAAVARSLWEAAPCSP